MLQVLFQFFKHFRKRRLVHRDGVVLHERMRGTGPGKRRDTDRAKFRKTHFQPGFLLEGSDPLRKLRSPAKADLAAEPFKAFVGVDADETVQGESAGFAVRKMPVLA